LNKLLKNTDKYIFKDGINFIEKMKKEQLYVVSYGDDKFQKKKIINSGIRHYFKKIMIAEDTKAVAIKKVLKKRKLENSEALIFIDDREKFLRDIKKSYPGMVTFLFGRPEGRYKDKLSRYCDFEVGNFKEVLNIIKKNGK
jgi:FMN phosphatase YigB (HAD superfamily)